MPSYAIIPAAGSSQRMGRPKLLLPWGSGCLMDHILVTWLSSQTDQVVVVVRRSDDPLRQACNRWPVHVVQAEPAPRDMKASIQLGLQFVREHWQPADDDRCLLAPADLPGLQSSIIDQLLLSETGHDTIVVPRFGARQGHPVVLPWSLTRHIDALADDEGVRDLFDRCPVQAVPFPPSAWFGDIDTPEDYQRLLRDGDADTGSATQENEEHL